MSTFFDLSATLLFIAAAGLFLYRLQFENPSLRPYLTVAGVCAFANWAGNSGAAIAAIALLVATAFLLVHIASMPFEED